MAGTIAALLATTLACASGPPAPPPAPPAPEWDDTSSRAADALEAVLASGPPAAQGELRVRLAFPAAADLDLYVSDPLDETVYYANTPVRSGGALDADQRCEHAAPRVETILFTAPLRGRYRVGVDFQHRCGSDDGPVPWVIEIEKQGERRRLRGLAEWNIFKSRVDEFEY
jgi:hypothetical protein